MTAADYAAWWGALTGTAALVWEIFAWIKTGPILKGDVQTGMRLTSVKGDSDYILVRVANVGDKPTTITHVAFRVMRRRFLRPSVHHEKPSFLGVNPIGVQLPFVLQPGHQWSGGYHDTISAELKKVGEPVCEITHSHSSRPYKIRIR